MSETTDAAHLRRLADQAERDKALADLVDLLDTLDDQVAELARQVRAGVGTPPGVLAAAHAVTDLVRRRLEHAAARYGKSHGMTWEHIGAVLDVTRSTAQARFAGEPAAELGRRRGRGSASDAE